MGKKPSVLFLCIGNSCRSQMAEGFMRAQWGDKFEVSSAGLRASTLDPLAVKVLSELGIDISQQQSKVVDSFKGSQFDWVVTVCEEGLAECPYFPAALGNIQVPFPDPPKLARGVTDQEAKLKIYRDTRDQIRAFIETLPERLLPG